MGSHTAKQIHNKKLVPLAKANRKNMTREEKHLWYDFLRKYPLNFIRQKIIGIYIADFYCPKASLVVELDGSQHYTEKGLENDRKRNEFFEGYGIVVLHIANVDIWSNFEGVCMSINRCVRERVGFDPLERKFMQDMQSVANGSLAERELSSEGSEDD